MAVLSGISDRPQFYAETIAAGLQPQILGSLVSLPGRVWRIVFLETGDIESAPGGPPVPAPVLIWQPWPDGTRLRLSAGSRGATVLITDLMLSNVLGHTPEAADLRMMLEHRLQADLAEEPEMRTDTAQCFRMILREMTDQGPGTNALVEAQCRVIAVLLWRLFLKIDQLVAEAPSDMRSLQSFRMLLETHFRDRWNVADYAEALGFSPDRLHSLCSRTLGRPPRDLIRERLAHEAQVLVRNSGQPLGTIAGQLGFVDTPQFSKFFRATFGMPPGQYRRRAAEAALGPEEAERSFADWP